MKGENLEQFPSTVLCKSTLSQDMDSLFETEMYPNANGIKSETTSGEKG